METKFSNNSEQRRLVLVVDDERVNRQLLGFILSQDYDVVYAQNGREAMEIIRENAGILSLVLLDLMMPEMKIFPTRSENRIWIPRLSMRTRSRGCWEICHSRRSWIRSVR
ncbi:MAG: response regulator [Lachnospiraceae bacterium]|nr:response regulator [Lachnospiraceae bacterium]